MLRILAVSCMIILTSACVNVQKPAVLADCEAKGTCANNPKDGPAPGTSDGAAIEDLGQGSGVDVGGALPDIIGDRAKTDVPDLGNSTKVDGKPDAELDTPPDSADSADDGADVEQPIPPEVPDGASDTEDANPDVFEAPPDSADAAVDTRDALPDVEEAPVDTRDAAAGLCTADGGILPTGTVCRPAAGACDEPELCDGISTECPRDLFKSVGIECRASAGDCDLAETCTGVNPACPIDVLRPLGSVCRAAAGVCDVPEVCSGTATVCPPNAYAAATTVCRVSVDGEKCDPAERCSGSTVTCPTQVIYAPPSPPSGLAPTPSANAITLNWLDSPGATSYSVFRNTDGSATYTFVNATAQTTYTDLSVSSGATYYYVVTAGNGSCMSGYSTQVSSALPCTPLAAPTGVTATAGNARVTVSWTAVTGATQYRVSRNTTGTAPFTQVATPTAITYLNTGLTNGTTYYYVVAAYNGACWSADSNAASATPTGATTPYVVYDDALQDGWVNTNWPGTTYNQSDTTPVQSGTASISVLYTGGWVGLMFHRDTQIDLVGRTQFTFWAHGGATGTRSVRFNTRNAANVYATYKIISIPSATWTQFTVTLAELGNPTNMVDISFQSNTAGAQPEFNIDNIQLE